VSIEPPSITRAEVEDRARRFATLRAAQRALAPSVRSPDSLPPLEPIRALRDQIRVLLEGAGDPPTVESRPEAPGKTDLDGVDVALDGYAHQLRHVADHVAVAQFRASLPGLAQEQRGEVIALLDLLIEDDEGLDARLSIVDYLITLVWMGARQNDQWNLIADPSTVSEGTRTRAFTQPIGDPAVEAEIVGRFRSATERLTGGEDFEAVVLEMQGYKKEITAHFFAPEVLRCIVAYNIALRHIRDRELSRERALDRDADREIGGAAEPDEIESQGASDSAFGSPGLAAIEGALERRLTGSDPAPGAAGQIAARANVTKLHASEVELFAQPPPDDLGRLKRRIIVLGLVVERLPEIQHELGALEVDLQLVVREWAREVADRVEKSTNDLISTNEYDEARRLSDLQSRILFSALVAHGRARGSAQPQPRRAARPAGAAAHAFTPPAKRAPKRSAKPAQRAAPAPRSARQPSRQRVSALAATLLLVGAGVGYHLLAPDPHAVRTLNEKQLSEVSPLLVSGYRSEGGQGLMFIGTLADNWQRMEEPARRKAAKRMHAQLYQDGVFEVILFNRTRALQVHYVGELNTFPGWDS
jgi:hypothetical protein